MADWNPQATPVARVRLIASPAQASPTRASSTEELSATMSARPGFLYDQHDARIEQLRVPPHSIEAEQAVLGGLMLAPEEAVTRLVWLGMLGGCVGLFSASAVIKTVVARSSP